MSTRTVIVTIAEYGSVTSLRVSAQGHFAQQQAFYTLAAQLFGYAESDGAAWRIRIGEQEIALQHQNGSSLRAVAERACSALHYRVQP